MSVLRTLLAQIAALEVDLATQLTIHPDTHIFASCPACRHCVPHASSARSATHEADSPPQKLSQHSPASCPRHANQAEQRSSPSATAATANYATHCATSPTAHAKTTPGPPTSTTVPSHVVTTTNTPYESSLAPGPTSSGDAGKTTSPTTPPTTEPSETHHPTSSLNHQRLTQGTQPPGARPAQPPGGQLLVLPLRAEGICLPCSMAFSGGPAFFTALMPRNPSRPARAR